VRLLLVEDEPALREGLVDLLRGDGHEVVGAADGPSGLAAGLEGPFDVVILDLALPGMDGLEVLRRLRAAGRTIAVLVLTARGSVEEKVTGLGEGADDYLTKPFAAKELLARVRALGRRVPPADAERVDVDGATLDLARLVFVRGGATVSLTPREGAMLRWLAQAGGRVVSRAEILERVWGQRGDLQTRAVDMAIAVLRKKIERDAGSPAIIVSVKGAGYAWGSGR